MLKELYNINVLKHEKPDTNKFITKLKEHLKTNYETVEINLVKKIPKNQNYENITKFGTKSVICDLGGEIFCHNKKYRDVKFDINKIQDVLKNTLKFKSKIISGSGCGHGLCLNNHQGELYYLNNQTKNGSFSIRTKNEKTIIDKYNHTYYGGFGNLNFYNNNKTPQNIIKIKVKKRIGSKLSFTKTIQEVLEQEDIMCGMSGLINIKNGDIKSHIQPDYTDCPEDYFCCESNKHVKGFLHFENIDTKKYNLNCITSIWSRKFKNNLGFRDSGEHTHFVSNNLTKGGHYHFDLDITKNTIEYEAYLVFSDYLVKVRNPFLEKPNVCVIGAGAMGCLFGGILSLNGLDVTLVDKWKDHINAINKHGLTMNFKNKNKNKNFKKIVKDRYKKNINIKAFNLDTLSENVKYDIIIIQTKSLQTKEVCQLIKNKNIHHNNTCFISFQNGLGNEDIISKEFENKNNVFGGLTLQGANIVKKGEINIHTNLTSYIGEWNKSNFMCQIIANIFTRYGIPTEYDANIKKRIWMKLIYNCVVSPLSAITNLCHKDIYIKGNSLKIAKSLIDECLVIAKKENIDISTNEGYECLKKVIDTKQNNKSSMCYDINNHNKSEINFINGKIVELGKIHNIETPINNLLTFLILGIES